MSASNALFAIAAAAVLVACRLHHLSLPAAVGSLIVAAFGYAVYHCYIYPFKLSPFRHLPEPPNGSSFPWAHAESLRHESNGESFRRWTNEVPNEGLIRFRVLFNQERLLITSPEGIKEVTVEKTNQFIKPLQPAFLLRKVLGNGVLMAEGEEHRRQRKTLMPAFSFRHIKDLYPVFWSKARHVTDEISKVSRSGPTPPAQRTYDWASRVTLDIIGNAAIGYDFDSVGNPDNDVIRVYRSLFENQPPHFRWSFIGIWMPLEFLFRLPLPMFAPAKAAAARIRQLGSDVVREKRAAIAAAAAAAAAASPPTDPKPPSPSRDIDILSIAMRSEQLSDADLVNQIRTFLAAGHETTASALTWSVHLLCTHPSVQTRLRAEIRSSLPPISSPTSTITSAAVDALPYLNAVCNEVLRFMPSVPMTIRDALVDTEVLGRGIPAGTRLYLSPWGMNHDRDLWGEDAGSFDPERWMGEGRANAGGALNNYANLTFLHGARACIGRDFAKAELKCLLAAWIGRFEVGWEDGKELPLDITGWVTVKPGHQLPVVFKELGGW